VLVYFNFHFPKTSRILHTACFALDSIKLEPVDEENRIIMRLAKDPETVLR
jgi:hypothetical protein